MKALCCNDLNFRRFSVTPRVTPARAMLPCFLGFGTHPVAVIAHSLENMPRGNPTGSNQHEMKDANLRDSFVSRSEAAEMMQVSPRFVANAVKFEREGRQSHGSQSKWFTSFSQKILRRSYSSQASDFGEQDHQKPRPYIPTRALVCHIGQCTRYRSVFRL